MVQPDLLALLAALVELLALLVPRDQLAHKDPSDSPDKQVRLDPSVQLGRKVFKDCRVCRVCQALPVPKVNKVFKVLLALLDLLEQLGQWGRRVSQGKEVKPDCKAPSD